MRWSDRSASPARRWSDRAARRRARRGLKIPEDDRSFFSPVLLHFEIAAGMLMVAATAVKAARGVSRDWERSCFVLPPSENTCFAFALREVALVFRGAVGRAGFAATDAHPVQRKPHPLRRHRSALRAEGSRIDAHPRDFRG